MRPRPYMSFSQMTTWEQSPEKYVEKYLYGRKERISRNIALGKQVADGLEAEEATGDPLLDLVMVKLPKFELMDKVVEHSLGQIVYDANDGKKYQVPALENGKEMIPLLAKPDTAKKDYSAFKEYKTSTRKWTQKMVDESGQITFYATAIWIATGKIPQDIELACAETAYREDGSLYATGNVWVMKTKRSMVDIIKMTGRIRAAWAGIQERCEKELL